MEDEESLETCAHVGQLADTVQHQVNNLLADGVVASCVVVGRVLLAGDQLLGVEQLAIGSSPNLIYKISSYFVKRIKGPNGQYILHTKGFVNNT